MKNMNQNIPAVILLSFIAVNVYVAAFNWEVFSTVLNIELGFGKVAMPPFFFLFFFGLLAILILWIFEYRRDLKNQITQIEKEAKITELHKDVEIEKLKAGGAKHIRDSVFENNKNKESTSPISDQKKSIETES